MNIPDLIDTQLRIKAQAEEDRPIAGDSLFRVSEACLPCARPTLFRAFGARPDIEWDSKTLRRFEVGHTTAEWIERQFVAAGVLLATELAVTDEQWRIGGHIDFIIRGDDGTPLGVELKSVQSRSFWYKAKRNGVVAGDHQLMQAAMYALLCERAGVRFDGQPVDRWVVLSVSKDDLTMQQDEVSSEAISQALTRIELLNDHYDAKTLPPCHCGEWFYKVCNYGYGNAETCCGESWLTKVSA